MHLGTWIYTKFFGNFIGLDKYGNRYYEGKGSPRFFNRKNRWIYYNGIPEPTKIPPEWYNWLHYQTEIPPLKNEKIYQWQQDSLPNLTGTNHAYYPSGHVFSGGSREKATGDYESWKPIKL